MIESTGTNPDRDEVAFEEMLADALEQELIRDCAIAQSQRERNDIWTIRENFEPVLKNLPFFNYDISVPIVRMENYVSQLRDNVLNLWPQALFMAFGHLSDCNLHFIICPRDDSGQDEEVLREQVEHLVYPPLAELQGAISAEHGIGFEKKAWLSVTRSPQEIELMRSLKHLLDPKNILMPGRVIDI